MTRTAKCTALLLLVLAAAGCSDGASGPVSVTEPQAQLSDQRDGVVLRDVGARGDVHPVLKAVRRRSSQRTFT